MNERHKIEEAIRPNTRMLWVETPSFELIGGMERARTFLRKIKVFTLAESLGGVASLAEHPATMSHASMPQQYREEIGISEGLIRLSVGLENVEDLIDDLCQALEPD